MSTTPCPHPAALAPHQLLRECDVRRTRRSGPGGQHRNKVETAVVIHHRKTGITAEASERRSQAQNQSEAVYRLRVKLALHVRTPVNDGHAPSALWRSRCREGRIILNPAHDDFPAMLAEALDVLAARDMNVSEAAAGLGCTASQLTGLLRDEPRALELVNSRRRELGLHPLK